jgi:hypothetical protein
MEKDDQSSQLGSVFGSQGALATGFAPGVEIGSAIGNSTTGPSVSWTLQPGSIFGLQADVTETTVTQNARVQRAVNRRVMANSLVSESFEIEAGWPHTPLFPTVTETRHEKRDYFEYF